MGAWRRESPAGHYKEGRKDGTPHGGFFTKADLAEIVAYAARRFVTVLPEIDMPGHMQAAIASYPELGNTGEQLEVLTDWGISEHVLNLEENAVRFCTDVLEEIMEVFPGQYVHIGGDECPTTEWESSPRAQQCASGSGSAGPRSCRAGSPPGCQRSYPPRAGGSSDGTRSWTPARRQGSVILCWEGKNAWRAAVEAARAGLEVVMAPEPWCYFDWAYSDDPREPLAIRSAISVEQVYSLEPVPDDLEKDLSPPGHWSAVPAVERVRGHASARRVHVLPAGVRPRRGGLVRPRTAPGRISSAASRPICPGWTRSASTTGPSTAQTRGKLAPGPRPEAGARASSVM